MVNKIINNIGTGLLIYAGYLRFMMGKLEPSYAIALVGALFIAFAQWRSLNR